MSRRRAGEGHNSSNIAAICLKPQSSIIRYFDIDHSKFRIRVLISRIRPRYRLGLPF